MLQANEITYEEAKAALIVRGYFDKPNMWLKIRGNTYVRVNHDLDGGPVVEMRHHSTTVAIMYPDGSCALYNDGRNSASTTERLNMVLRPLNCHAAVDGDSVYVMDSTSQKRRKFFDGIVITPTK